jgi:hypothetical protein
MTAPPTPDRSAQCGTEVSDSDNNRLPDFVIVGQPKTGTTALHTMLNCHPQIYMPALKEPYYFADELADNPPPANLPTTLADYVALFAPAAPGQLTGEASVFYLWSSTAARNIARAKPDARIIVILREPASFLHSLHLQFIRVRFETEMDLRKALALEPERRNGRQLPSGGYWPPLLLYSEHMRYMDQLHRYRQTFSDDQLLVLLYDDFRAENRAVLRTILRFLEVDDTVSLSEVETNLSTRIRARGVENLVRAISEGHGPRSSIVKTAIETVTTQRLRRSAQKAINHHIVYAKPQAPDRELVTELRHRYKPEVVALSEYLGRDLVTLWGYDDLD